MFQLSCGVTSNEALQSSFPLYLLCKADVWSLGSLSDFFCSVFKTYPFYYEINLAVPKKKSECKLSHILQLAMRKKKAVKSYLESLCDLQTAKCLCEQSPRCFLQFHQNLLVYPPNISVWSFFGSSDFGHASKARHLRHVWRTFWWTDWQSFTFADSE